VFFSRGLSLRCNGCSEGKEIKIKSMMKIRRGLELL
jgi:hypothetical protein